ncbi:MAG TPA: class I SAM-dependent methyltransferase [Bacteroidales bacterium]|nr:class I SAM-dependent methyltransferase [Bacteroidales bacterium]HNZ42506.1 class I SAM-dependent methyltransferase [Bacteroidales bacterium]HOH84224.1 class I SAM-dependent methyltransferase [Bacteroidales bacterium]HPB25168.1 class I SAM-dependent methyltransferase [Bacteroidales bacterium]HPI31191.1 class I SAM-dependent methyltransferase [Bacteroidales bacterium]
MMNYFDKRAREWDDNPMHAERSAAIAEKIIEHLPATPVMRAMEYGAGTGILSFMLRDYFDEIVLLDSSREMLKVTGDKIIAAGAVNLKTRFFDLEKEELTDEKFDVIFTQMVLHHIEDVTLILKRFSTLLNEGGIVAIADLYPEDGTFHGEDFKGHKGFDVNQFAQWLTKTGFAEIHHRPCFSIKKQIGNETKEYPVFLITAKSNA